MQKWINKFAQLIAKKLIEQLGVDGFRVQLIKVQPGDLIFVKCDEELDSRTVDYVQSKWETLFPNNRVVVSHGFDLAVIHALKKAVQSEE